MSTTASNYFGAKRIVPKYQIIASGSGTWSVPANIVDAVVWVTMVGGGGSGRVLTGSNGETHGGCGGEAIQQVRYATGGGTGYTVGAGGTANTTGDGVDGNASTFGLLTCNGGSGGGTPVEDIVGTPGTVRDSTGILPPASPGGPYGGQGGAWDEDHYGGGGGLILFTGTAIFGPSAVDGKGYGAGSGGLSASGTTSAGHGGVIFLEWYEYETD